MSGETDPGVAENGRVARDNRVVVLTPFAKADQLAAACVLAKIHGHVVPVGDFNAVVVAEPDLELAREQAASLSKLSGRNEVLLLVRDGGQIDSSQWRRGLHEADVPAGLALSKLPDVLEKVLLGSVEAAEVSGSIDTRSMSRLEASAATMSPERMRTARTAMLWLLGGLLAFVLLIVFVVIAVAGNSTAWFGAVVTALLTAAAAWRAMRLLRGGKT
ncbi:hypothetical protein LWF01_05075 [Saxibacter everestensis]|uniref:Uncharacterized protein n=1 Tax=Saxibacter everestensis TaxID=2909229 RepID=A0ABY8QY87_9MICO|nr:hypothetical protein LWF01_05075 [Brevibacteriaceae bacterium ZFBP1038]